jgi:hypothetical protein
LLLIRVAASLKLLGGRGLHLQSTSASFWRFL